MSDSLNNIGLRDASASKNATHCKTALVSLCVHLPPHPVKVVPAQNCPRDRNDSEEGEGHQDIIVNITNLFSINITNFFICITIILVMPSFLTHLVITESAF